jgi:hypothetical protein
MPSIPYLKVPHPGMCENLERAMQAFFFVRDTEGKFRFFSAEPVRPPELKRSKLKASWELAKKKLMILPQRSLRQELAFAQVGRIPDPEITIFCSGLADEERIDSRFHFFLLRKRTKSLAILIGEAIVLPFTALTMPLPGPNVIFYILALLIITHWQSFRGIRAILKKKHDLRPDPLLSEWEEAVKARAVERYPDILARIEAAHNLQGLRKILWN